MPVSHPRFTTLVSVCPDHARDPKSFSGWAMAKAALLDRAGARGFVADLLTASTLRRQAAFVVLATMPLGEPRPFLERLGEPNGSLGDVIRFRRARDLIAAAFEIMPEVVPSGFERALIRIGDDPLRRGHLYGRLFAIISEEPHGPKAHALRYCGPITSAIIEALDLLDPVLLDPEIVRNIHSPGVRAMPTASCTLSSKSVRPPPMSPCTRPRGKPWVDRAWSSSHAAGWSAPMCSRPRPFRPAQVWSR